MSGLGAGLLHLRARVSGFQANSESTRPPPLKLECSLEGAQRKAHVFWGSGHFG